MSEFTKELNEIKGDLDRNLISPVMTASRVGRLLLRLVNVTIKENQRLNKRIDELEEYANKIESDLNGHRL